MTELIKMPFWLWAQMGPRNRVRWGPDPPWEGVFLRGKGAVRSKVEQHSAVICTKTAEPIQMSFGLWTQVGP